MNKRKFNSEKVDSNKKNKVKEDQDAILAMGGGYEDDDQMMDSDEEESVVGFNAKYYDDNDDSDDGGDYLDSDDDENLLDDSEAVVGRSTILPEKNDSSDPKFINLKVKTVDPLSKQFKAPTTEEIQELKNTQDLFNSNLFRLQVNELFKEIKVDYQKLTSLESALHHLKSIIEKIPDQEVDVFKNRIENVKILDYNGNMEELNIQFKKPSSIEVIGSFMTQTCLKNNSNVDLLLEIPNECLSKSDANDYKYFTKRNLYLWTIAKEIKKNPRFQDIEFTNFNGDTLKQILLIKPREDPVTGAKTKFTIRIFLTISKTIFNIYPKFNPLQCCLISNTTDNSPNHANYNEDSDSESNNDKDKEKLKQTPYYNNSILEDIYLYDHMSFIHERFDNAPVLMDTSLLLKTWLELKLPNSSINSFHITMILIHCYNIGKVNKSMSSYQAFRMVMNFVSKELNSNKIVQMKLDQESIDAFGKIKTTKTMPSGNPYELEFKKLYPLSIIDPSGLLNLTSRVNIWDLRDFRSQCRKTLALLDQPDSFEEVFLKKYHFFTEYDYIVRITLSNNQYKSSIVPSNDYYQKDKFYDHTIYKLLKKSLTKRVRSITIQKSSTTHASKWYQEMPDFDKINRTLVIGIVIDPVNWQSLIDMGPSGDHIKASVFQKFWGSKSQLRQFKDGSIHEAVTWTPKDGHRHLVIEDSIKYILNMHLSIPPTSVSSIISQFDTLVSSPLVLDQTIQVMRAKEEISSAIRSLSLPLGIEAIHSLSPAARYTGITGYFDKNYQQNVPIELLLTFESSLSWPFDADAIYALKTAFLLKISREFQESHPQYSPKLTNDYLDLQCSGYVFRLIPYYSKESEVIRSQGRNELADSLDHLQRRATYHSFIQSLHTAHPSYGPATRLAMRWIHSHLLSSYIGNEAIELIVASLYNSTNNTPPQTPIMAFLRFLFLIYTHNWSDRILVSDYQGTIDQDKINSLQSQYDQLKQSPKSSNSVPLMYVITEKDQTSSWFRDSFIQSPIILNRMAQFATISIQKIENLFAQQNDNQSSWNTIFQDSQILNEFDLIFYLNENLVPNHYLETQNILQNKNFKSTETNSNTNTKTNENNNSNSKSTFIFKNLINSNINNSSDSSKSKSKVQNSGHLMFGFNPVELFVSQLKSSFSEYCLIFYDNIGGDKIALKWIPKTFEPIPFKPTKSKYSIPVETPTTTSKNNMVTFNLNEIINDMNIMGGKLIKSFKLLPNSNNMIKKYK